MKITLTRFLSYFNYKQASQQLQTCCRVLFICETSCSLSPLMRLNDDDDAAVAAAASCLQADRVIAAFCTHRQDDEDVVEVSLPNFNQMVKMFNSNQAAATWPIIFFIIYMKSKWIRNKHEERTHNIELAVVAAAAAQSILGRRRRRKRS